jgi:AraC family transcriptional regulator
VIFDNNTYSAKVNDVIFLNCHEPHGYYTETGWEILWVHFDGNSSKQFFELIYNLSGVILPLGKSNVIQHSLTSIINGYKTSKPLPESVFSLYIHRILTEMILLSSNYSDIEAPKINPVFEAITYIESNYSKNISLKDVSSYVNLSPYHFSRIFKKETGYSPYEFIIKTRIDKAKILLKQTNMSIKEIAFSVGFNCESNFIDTFRKSINQTPKAFRDTHF